VKCVLDRMRKVINDNLIEIEIISSESANAVKIGLFGFLSCYQTEPGMWLSHDFWLNDKACSIQSKGISSTVSLSWRILHAFLASQSSLKDLDGIFAPVELAGSHASFVTSNARVFFLFHKWRFSRASIPPLSGCHEKQNRIARLCVAMMFPNIKQFP
jgi:hypothetical protein